MSRDWKPEILNLELTTKCPLRCPQCYCSLENGLDLDVTIAKRRIDEACEMGLTSLNLSGGETLCYPHLYEIISYASQKNIPSILVALSGALFDQDVYVKLVDSGVTGICVSLNGSTESINSISRAGYHHAINALEILSQNDYPNITINWVMHSTNADDFENLVRLAEHYHVGLIDIISLKPDSQKAMRSFPTKEQIANVSRFIKRYKGPVKIMIESCFSNLAAYHLETRLFGNLNITEHKGCMAGRCSVSVNVLGQYTPCRHIDKTEDFSSLREYWSSSQLLAQLRAIDTVRKEPCSSCYFGPYCRHCQAISWEIRNELCLGFENCPMHSESRPQ